MARKLTISAARADGGAVEVEGYDSETPGLGVYRLSPDSWPVIHLASGASVDSMRTRAGALELARRLGALGDWTEDAGSLDPKTLVAARLLSFRLGLELDGCKPREVKRRPEIPAAVQRLRDESAALGRWLSNYRTIAGRRAVAEAQRMRERIARELAEVEAPDAV